MRGNKGTPDMQENTTSRNGILRRHKGRLTRGWLFSMSELSVACRPKHFREHRTRQCVRHSAIGRGFSPASAVGAAMAPTNALSRAKGRSSAVRERVHWPSKEAHGWGLGVLAGASETSLSPFPPCSKFDKTRKLTGSESSGDPAGRTTASHIWGTQGPCGLGG